MRVNEQWLREWVNPKVSTEQIAVTLTMAGLEVDSVDPVASAFSGVCVGGPWRPQSGFVGNASLKWTQHSQQACLSIELRFGCLRQGLSAELI